MELKIRPSKWAHISCTCNITSLEQPSKWNNQSHISCRLSLFITTKEEIYNWANIVHMQRFLFDELPFISKCRKCLTYRCVLAPDLLPSGFIYVVRWVLVCSYDFAVHFTDCECGGSVPRATHPSPDRPQIQDCTLHFFLYPSLSRLSLAINTC